MLLRFAVANHLSICDGQELSMVASSLSDAEEGLIDGPVSPSGSLLPAVVVYGANASGKTNLVDALHTMRHMILRSHLDETPEGGVTVRKPFRLDAESESAPSRFEIDFVLGGVRHHYGFEATDEAFVSEWLQDYPVGRGRVLFERDGGEFRFGRGLKGRNRVIADLTRANSLFLSAAAQNGHEVLTLVRGYFARIQGVSGLRRGTAGSGGLSFAGPSAAAAIGTLDPRVMNFLGKAEIGVVGHRLRETTHSESDRQLMSELAEMGIKTPPERMEVLELAHRRSDGEDVYFELERESTGTRRLLVVLTRAFAALDSGTLLVVDELDAGLHTAAAQAVLDLFCAHKTNPNGAQLIATTHDTNLLKASKLRRDQVWFAEKARDGATRTYPLTDIRTRKGDDLERGYLQRRYGAAPRQISSDRAIALEA